MKKQSVVYSFSLPLFTVDHISFVKSNQLRIQKPQKIRFEIESRTGNKFLFTPQQIMSYICEPISGDISYSIDKRTRLKRGELRVNININSLNTSSIFQHTNVIKYTQGTRLSDPSCDLCNQFVRNSSTIRVLLNIDGTIYSFHTQCFGELYIALSEFYKYTGPSYIVSNII